MVQFRISSIQSIDEIEGSNSKQLGNLFYFNDDNFEYCFGIIQKYFRNDTIPKKRGKKRPKENL